MTSALRWSCPGGALNRLAQDQSSQRDQECGFGIGRPKNGGSWIGTGYLSDAQTRQDHRDATPSSATHRETVSGFGLERGRWRIAGRGRGGGRPRRTYPSAEHTATNRGRGLAPRRRSLRGHHGPIPPGPGRFVGGDESGAVPGGRPRFHRLPRRRGAVLAHARTPVEEAAPLAAIHELRAIAHVIDMHQVAKDPEGLHRRGPVASGCRSRRRGRRSNSTGTSTTATSCWPSSARSPPSMSRISRRECRRGRGPDRDACPACRRRLQKIMVLDRIADEPTPSLAVASPVTPQEPEPPTVA